MLIADLIEQHLKKCGTGSIRVNTFDGGVSSINQCETQLAKNVNALLTTIERRLGDDFDTITIKRAKVGYCLNIEKTVRYQK